MSSLRAWDQSREEWIRNVKPADRGTGILVLPDRLQQWRKLFAPDITLDDYVNLGDTFSLPPFSRHAGKWVPDTVENIDVLIETACGQLCNDLTGCITPACVCIDGKCI